MTNSDENVLISVDERISTHLQSVYRRIRYIEGSLLALGDDISSLKAIVARLNAKLAVESREENKKKGIKIEDVIEDMILKGKAVEIPSDAKFPLSQNPSQPSTPSEPPLDLYQ